MTTSPPSRPLVGNGVRAVIPPAVPAGTAEPGEQASLALAPFREVSVPVGVIEAARHLIKPLCVSEDARTRSSAGMVLDYLDAALAKAAGQGCAAGMPRTRGGG
ncbi:hypothetical protein ACIHFE_32435 [Streptomyces sp. NPDC052396]|uniref:hypothetical protein n=1 Tax=Streptomyces sp. NPDC052396 TaxID=3365689 RepID=UPI0037CDD8D7